MIASVSPEAERELIATDRFYAQGAGAELGLAFIAEFERSVDLLRTYPRLGPVWLGTTRRFPCRRFPYSIIYQVKPDEVRVIAIAHQHRRPGYWRGRE